MDLNFFQDWTIKLLTIEGSGHVLSADELFNYDLLNYYRWVSLVKFLVQIETQSSLFWHIVQMRWQS